MLQHTVLGRGRVFLGPQTARRGEQRDAGPVVGLDGLQRTNGMMRVRCITRRTLGVTVPYYHTTIDVVRRCTRVARVQSLASMQGWIPDRIKTAEKYAKKSLESGEKRPTSEVKCIPWRRSQAFQVILPSASTYRFVNLY